MHEPDSGSKTSPLVVSLLLGGLGLASLFVIWKNQEIPGVLPKERDVVSKSLLGSVQQDLQRALAAVQPRTLFCERADLILAKLDFGPKRRVLADDLLTREQRRYFPQTERDAWYRCQATPVGQHLIRRKLCFQVQGSGVGTKLWDRGLALVELNLEWHRPGTKRPISCQEWQSESTSTPSLLVYYSVYAGKNRGRVWGFQRMTGGLFFPHDASAAGALSRAPISNLTE